jgi:hypothetical protein
VVTRYAAEPLAPPAALTVGSAPRARRVAPPLLLAGGLLALSVALHVRDPHQSGTWGYCPWLLLTGTACPGCGGLRAVNDLTRGDVAAAFSSNALFVGQRWRDDRTPLRPAVIAWAGGAALALLLAFWVVRNLPFANYLAP